MGWLKDWREDMKGTWLFDTAKSVGRYGAKAVQYTAPYAGGFVFGPLGALAGTGLSMAAGQVGPTKNRSSQAKRDAIHGGAVTLGTTALSLATGQGFSGTLQQSFNSLFGWGPTPPAPTVAKPMTDADLYKALFPGPGGTIQTPPGASTGTGLLDLAGKLIGGTQANPANLQQQYLDQVALAEKYRKAGDMAAAQQAAALAEVYRQQLIAQGTPVPTGGAGLPIGLLLIAAGGAWLLLRRKK